MAIAYVFDNKQAIADQLMNDAKKLRNKAALNSSSDKKGWRIGGQKHTALINEAYGLEQAAHVIENAFIRDVDTIAAAKEGMNV